MRWILLAALSLLVSGCSSATRRPPAEDGGPEADLDADVDQEPVDCQLEAGEPFVIEIAPPWQWPPFWDGPTSGPLVTDGETLILTVRGTSGEDPPEDTEVASYDLETGELEQLTFNDVPSWLLDGREGVVLIGNPHVELIDRATGSREALDSQAPQLLDVGHDDVTIRPRRMVDAQQAAWLSEGLLLWSRLGAVEALEREVEDQAGPPMLVDDGLLWLDHLTYDSGTRLQRWAADDHWSTLMGGIMWTVAHSDGERAILGVVGGALLYEHGELREVPLPGVTGEVPCGDPYLRGDAAAVVCGDALYRLDLATEEATVVATTTVEYTGRLGGPRLNGRGVLVWVELLDMCEGTARVMLEHQGRTQEVARVVTDSYCVGHLPLPISLELTEGYVVWADLEGIFAAPLDCLGEE
jgi:hypothetical protein